jgi:perosamine synthetase
MVLTDDEELVQRLRRLRNLAFAEGPRFRHDELGWNYRMGSLQAAMGSAQLASAESRMMRKRSIGLRYRELLADIDHLQLPVDNWRGQENVYWVFGFLVDRDAGVNAQSLGEALRTHGVDSRPFFFPLHQQVALKRIVDPDCRFPNAERIAELGLYVPSGANLLDSDLVRVADAVRAVLL